MVRKEKKIKELGFDNCKCYGVFLLESITYPETLKLIDFLIKQGYLYENKVSNYRFLVVTREGINLMTKHHDIEIQGLFEELPKETVTKRELKVLRKKVANECNVSPFIIFNNLVLENIEQKKPTTRDEFLTINGLAEAKWGQFGEQVCQIYRT